jgi:hypothetical protein
LEELLRPVRAKPLSKREATAATEGKRSEIFSDQDSAALLVAKWWRCWERGCWASRWNTGFRVTTQTAAAALEAQFRSAHIEASMQRCYCPSAVEAWGEIMQDWTHVLNTGRIRVSIPTDHVLLVEIAGHFSSAFLPSFFTPAKLAIINTQRLGIFYDWETMTDYDTICRQEMTKWALAERGRIEGHHVLTKSKLVAMGVTTAGLMLSVMGSKLIAYQNNDDFEKELRARGTARRPLLRPAVTSNAG